MATLRQRRAKLREYEENPDALNEALESKEGLGLKASTRAPIQGPPRRPRSILGLVVPTQYFRILFSIFLIALPCLSYVWLMKQPPVECLETGYFCEKDKVHSWARHDARSGTSGKTHRDFEAHTVLACFGASLFSLLWLAHTDPGTIPAEGASAGEAKPELQQNPVKGEKPLHLCPTCQIYKPSIQTHHCSTCNVCVEDFDHHCDWIGTCVTHRNMRQFVCFLLSLAFCSLLVGYWSAVKAHDWVHKALIIYWEDFAPHQGGEEKKMAIIYQHGMHTMVFSSILGYALLALLAICFLLFRMSWNIAAGVTTKDALKGKKANWSQDTNETFGRFHHMFLAPRKPSKL